MNDAETTEFWEEVFARIADGQRRGQAIMNAVFGVSAEIYAELSGTDRDCFYRDERIPATLAYLDLHSPFAD